MKKINNYLQTLKGKIILGISITSISIVLTSAVTRSDLFEIGKNIDIFTSVYKELNTYYVDEIDPNKMMRTGIDAMLETCDPYTNYISEAEIEGYKFQITGNYGGIGAVIRPVDGDVTVISTYDGFPADKAGLEAGDIIVEIDGKKASGRNSDEVSEILRGSPGTNVIIKYKKPFEEKIYELAIAREEIKIDNVPYFGMVNNNIGYIILTQFTENSGRNVANAYNELKEKNPGLKGIILDLRGNPGGLLNEAVNVSNVFIEKGKEICSTKGRVAEWDKSFTAINAAIDTQVPLVVLTNSRSASASEIVSGVVQDYDRGVIVGQKTYGKGLVQTTRDISYNTKLKLTTAKYYIPSGRCIQALDYSHRNEDGSVGKIPDSLKTAFKTSSGRTVYDGGGVDPDITVETENYKDITISLLAKNLIFGYSTKYKYDHATIADAKTFSLTDVEYETFIKWLAGKDYDYTTETEKLLNDLEAKAKEDAYYEALKTDIEDLRKGMGHDKEKDLYKFKDEILFELNKEIVSRYYNEDGIIEVGFKTDPDVLEAVKILSDPVAYNALLKPNK
ncbi:MAG: S41 family peptidase [Fimbriimonadaceae bacterium]|nr:S41 family peptidase [Chitinophagales bacterium]